MDRRHALITLAGLRGLLAFAEEKEKTLSPEELSKLLENPENIFFLDVREPKEIEEGGSVKGYVNIPLGQLEGRLSEIPKDKQIVTFCQRGTRAGRAADLLRKNGYKIVGICGLVPYKEKGYPVVYPKKEEKR